MIGVRFFLCILLHLVLIDAYKYCRRLPQHRGGIIIRSIRNRECFRQHTNNGCRLFATKNSDSFKKLRNIFHISNAVIFFWLSVPHFSDAKDLESSVLIYRSGKNPDASSNINKDSKVGTKKDINFLRCMSNCKSQCQLPGEGLVKTDCVQDCQDQCCDSYEQCSFKIKINTGNSI